MAVAGTRVAVAVAVAVAGARVGVAVAVAVAAGAVGVEVGGSGMVHPRVLEGVGIDPEEFSGFAFGLGIDRMAGRMYDIDDIRLLFENDIRFLEQFV